jgi:hypothetical protein
MTYPQTAAEAIAFIGNHYAQMHEAPDPLDTRFLLSVHDLLSAFRWAAGQGQVVDQDKLLDQVIAAWLAPPLLTDAQRAAIATGYESGTLATDPGALGATIHLHYASGPEAEAAFDAITRIIDALVAHSGIPASARQETP